MMTKLRKLQDLLSVYGLLRRGGNGVWWSLKQAHQIVNINSGSRG